MSTRFLHPATARRAAIAPAVLAALALACSAPPQAAGATLRIPLPRDPGTLTPLTFTLGYPLLTLVYDTITWRDARGVPRPWLARSVQPSDGGRRIVVRLRDGLRWHDGRALTARDVAFTYELMRARRHPRFAPQLRAIASVRATGRRTVEFRLRHPSIGFADQPLADVPILPAHLWRGLPPGLRAPAGPPIGSGPYRWAGRRPDGGPALEAVDDYFMGRPRAERVEVPIIPGANEMLDALRRGDVDVVPFTLTPPQAGSLDPASMRFARGPLFLGTMLMFNLRRPPFDDAHARRAVAGALDVERIVRAAGAGTLATTGALHPRSRWAPAPRAPRRPREDRALAALDLPPLRVLAPANDPLRREVGRQVVLALRRAGAGARLVPLSRARLGDAVGEGGRRASFELAIWSVPALASHDPDYLAPVFGGGGALNRSGYASAAFDRAAARVAAARTVQARRRAVVALLGRLRRDVPSVPLLFGEGVFAYRPAARIGWTYLAGTGILDKRSLLRAAAPASAARAGAAGAAEGAEEGGGTSLLMVLAAGMLALGVLIAVAVALARKR